VFAEFERSMIQDRVKAGMARAHAEGVVFGRPKIDPKKEEQIRELLKQGVGLVSIARKLGCGVSAVQRVQREALSFPQR
jgi:DNA invertase Pin-like site-specific DNA recombinase